MCCAAQKDGGWQRSCRCISRTNPRIACVCWSSSAKGSGGCSVQRTSAGIPTRSTSAQQVSRFGLRPVCLRRYGSHSHAACLRSRPLLTNLFGRCRRPAAATAVMQALTKHDTNEMFHGQIMEDMRSYINGQGIGLAGLHEWAKQSQWAHDTGGDRDANGVPIRAVQVQWPRCSKQSRLAIRAGPKD